MSATVTLPGSETLGLASDRRIVHKTRGQGHGAIVRLMSPSDLGEVVKPVVFLDLFEGDMRLMQNAMQLHPHSGIATITVFPKGDVRYDDPEAGQGTLTYGGVEWMRASGGVWHGKEIAAGASARVQGFQLWVALPPELENEVPDSQYVEATDMQQVGPAHVIVGAYEGAQSPIRAPDGLNYLLITLKPGETWTYSPPVGHTVGWLAVAQGELAADGLLQAGDMGVYEDGEAGVTVTSTGAENAIFVFGSAVPHGHRLHLGYYSVHTSAAALAQGEARIAELQRKLIAAGDRRTGSGTTPVYR
jgi:redox-sensitive bicupin YhaK (pirin superfamily)